MKKEDKVFVVLLLLSNVLGLIFLFYSTIEDVNCTIDDKQTNLEDSIRKHINEGYIFDHSQIK